MHVTHCPRYGLYRTKPLVSVTCEQLLYAVHWLQAAAAAGGAEATAGALQRHHTRGEGQPSAAEHGPDRAPGGRRE